MPVRALAEYLEENKADYHAYNHPPAITAQEVAQSAHVSGAQLAKTVIVNGDGEMAMAVLPADRRVNETTLARLMGADRLDIAPEEIFKMRFPQCEVGGMPPIGGMYDMRVFMDRALLEYDWIAFNAGTHTEIIKMDTGVFKRLVKPTLGSFTQSH